MEPQQEKTRETALPWSTLARPFTEAEEYAVSVLPGTKLTVGG